MSRHESEDREGLGYLLPEESQLRLARLSDHIRFLARMAQSRIAQGSLEHAPEVSMGELTFCLEALADQLDLVLDEVSWPAQGTATVEAPVRDVMSAARPEATGTNTGRFIFGVTLDQIDTLGRLIQTISAHGDVVSSSDMPDLAKHTLPMLGYAIFDGAAAVRDILAQVEEQRLGEAPHRRPGVGEERGVYAVALVSPAAARNSPRGLRPTGSPVRLLWERRQPRTGARRRHANRWPGIVAFAAHVPKEVPLGDAAPATAKRVNAFGGFRPTV
jgi:hypothetical protein